MSDKKKNSIDEAIGVDSPDEEQSIFIDEETFEVIIPEHIELDAVARLALEAYKEQMEQIQMIEPKYRSRALEVAQRYLETAKDSIARQEDLKLKLEKLEIDKNKKNDDPNQKGNSSSGGLSRDSVLRGVK